MRTFLVTALMTGFASPAWAAAQMECYDGHGIADSGYVAYANQNDDGRWQAEVGEAWFGGVRELGAYEPSLTLTAAQYVLRANGFTLTVDRSGNGHGLHSGRLVTDTPAIDQAMVCTVGDVFAETNALNIQMFGMGPAVDAVAYGQLLAKIGAQISAANLMTFDIIGFGIEGGSASCAELSPFADITIDEFWDDLMTITPNPSTTSYTIRPAKTCE